MSTRVLALNDTGVSLWEGQTLICSSPAYMLVENKKVVFGDDAASRSRLLPLQCNNSFWYRLNMEPLPRALANFRNNADIAHAHLAHIAETSETDGDVIVAVPGSLGKDQLALLAGLLKHTPFKPVGLVDSATAAVAGQRALAPLAPGVLYLDLHLHQLVISRLGVSAGLIERQQLVASPDLGWIPLSNSLVQLATDAFIRQCRFNPRDNALWEQALYDQLPQWLDRAASEENNLVLEVSTDSARHQARVTTDAMRNRLQPAFQKLLQHVQTLANAETCQVLMSPRTARLPGVAEFLASHLPENVQVVADPVPMSALSQACLAVRDQFLDAGGNIRFVTSLAVSAGDSTPAPSSRAGAELVESDPEPTHVLHEHSAWRLNGGIDLMGDENGALSLVAGSIAGQGSQLLGRISASGGQILLQTSKSGLVVNGVPVQGESPLALGDSIGTEMSNDSLRLIRVHDGQG